MGYRRNSQSNDLIEAYRRHGEVAVGMNSFQSTTALALGLLLQPPLRNAPIPPPPPSRTSASAPEKPLGGGNYQAGTKGKNNTFKKKQNHYVLLGHTGLLSAA